MHAPFNSPPHLRQRRRYHPSTYVSFQTNLSIRSKYSHYQSRFWARAINGELKSTWIKTLHKHPCTEGYISVYTSRRQLSSGKRLYLRSFMLGYIATPSIRHLVSWKFHKMLTKEVCAKIRSQLYPGCYTHILINLVWAWNISVHPTKHKSALSK